MFAAWLQDGCRNSQNTSHRRLATLLSSGTTRMYAACAALYNRCHYLDVCRCDITLMILNAFSVHAALGRRFHEGGELIGIQVWWA